MKKLLIALGLILSMATSVYAVGITVDAFISPDSVTIPHLEQFRTRVVDAINSFPGDNIQAGTVTETKLDSNTSTVTRWAETFNNFVYSGCLPQTGTRAAATITAGVAYVVGERVVKTDITPGATNYPSTKYIYVDLSNVGTYTYQQTAIGAAEPAVTANSIRLARVTTNATDVTAVRDDRVMGVQLSTNEDFYVNGMYINNTGGTKFSADAGIVYHGAIRLRKASATTIDITDAASYVTGASERGANKWLYVYVSSGGSVLLEQTAPNRADVAGDTAGILYYYYDGSIYYRCIGQVRLDASQNLIGTFQQGNFFEYDVPVIMSTTVSAGAWTDGSTLAKGDCSTLIPATSTRALFGISITSTAPGTGSVILRPHGSTSTANYYAGICGTGFAVGNETMSGEITSFTDSSQKVDFYNDAGTNAMNIYVKGYWVNIK